MGPCAVCTTVFRKHRAAAWKRREEERKREEEGGRKKEGRGKGGSRQADRVEKLRFMMDC